MRLTPSAFFWGLLLLSAMSLAACQERSLGEVLWPDLHDPYFQLTEQWSRKGVIRIGLESELSFIALLKSKEWRTAYVTRHARLQSLGAQEREKMLADQMQAHGEAVDVVLAVASTNPDHSRLTHRSSRWRVLMQTADGQQVEPLEIRPLHWSRLELQAYFPEYHHWQRYFAVRFPTGLSGPLTLVITGPPGRTALAWDEYQ
jgi:hypothetical protein